MRFPRSASVAVLSLAACSAAVDPIQPVGAGSVLLPVRLGAADADGGRAVATDGAGNVLATGFASGTVDFDPGALALNRTAIGGTDIYLVRLTAEGTVSWATLAGGPGADLPFGVVATGDGGAVVAGSASAGTLCPNAVTNDGGRDAVVLRFDAQGVCQWAVSVGSAGDDEARAIALGAGGELYVAGVVSGPAVARDAATVLPGPIGGLGAGDAFVARIGSDGRLAWVRTLGGGEQDEGAGIAVDAAGNVYVGGLFTGTADLDPGPGTTVVQDAGGGDLFVARLTTAGDFTWGVRGGGVEGDRVGIGGVLVAPGGEVVVSGSFAGAATFGGGVSGGLARSLTSAGLADVFVARHDAATGALVDAFAVGGAGTDEGRAFAADGSGDLYVAGSFSGSADFDGTAGVLTRTAAGSAGATDAFVARYAITGTPRWVTTVGAPLTGAEAFTAATGLALGANDALWATGRFHGAAGFAPATGATTLTSLGASDAFVAQLARLDGRFERR